MENVSSSWYTNKNKIKYEKKYEKKIKYADLEMFLSFF